MSATAPPRRLAPSAATVANQLAASDPATSAWVSANAGAGKTSVLARRVIRLLVAGVDPARILCLTFTKAAAAEMANRVFRVLSAWTTMDDAALARAVADIEGRDPSTPLPAAELAHARRLFAAALDTPGGLKIQTIHAFAERLLHLFPLEANVPARYEVLDEPSRQELLLEARRRTFARARRGDGPKLKAALEAMIAIAADDTIESAIDAAIGSGELAAALREIGEGGEDPVGRLMADAATVLGVGPEVTVADVERRMLAAAPSPAEARRIAEVMAAGSKTDADGARRLLAYAEAAGDAARLAALCEVMFTGGGSGGPRKSLATNGTAAALGPLYEGLIAAQQAVAALDEERKAAALLDRSRALLTLADAALDAYSRAKRRRGALDFDDLIAAAERLLTRTSTSWVLYKLDGGIDHLLVDEAQDTNPAQWRIIRSLVAEFTAGEGRFRRPRTLFAVGDEKQSIYGFQGADPAAFDVERRHYAAAFREAGRRFETLAFTQSFRSTTAVLAAVDRIFATGGAHVGLSADAVPPVHESARAEAPGIVELWPLIEPEPLPEPEDAWSLPLDAPRSGDPAVRLAERIAAGLKAMIERGEALADGTPMTAGDVLILVRKRGALFEAIIRSLKRAGLPVAGADRIVLADQIAVQDLVALGEALVAPHDDLALAAALKSPLFGLTDDELIALAARRPGTLRAAIAADPGHAALARRLDALEREARSSDPFSFYARLLGRDGARAAFLARLGAEAEDAIDEFLAFAAARAQSAAPSLPDLLAAIRSQRVDIKRDLAAPSGEVRVMTVHGAKGLEAPVVVLADAGRFGSRTEASALVGLPRTGGGAGRSPLPLWPSRRERDPAALAAARDAARRRELEEHRRLLYVALTRAADRLIVAGHRGARALDEDAWYMAAVAGLDGLLQPAPAPWGEGTILRAGTPVVAASGIRRPEAERPALPPWLGAPVAAAAAAPRLSPSRLAVAPRRPEPGGAEGGGARRRGVLLHRLFEALPQIEPGRRRAAGTRYLEAAAPAMPAAEREALVAAVAGIIGDPRFAAAFGPAGRAEVAIAGEIRRDGMAPLAVAGRIDRLVVEERHILLLDIKTGKPPADAAGTPESYVAQLALYRELLRSIYPGREVSAAILWTGQPVLMPLAEGQLDRALAHVTGADAFLDAAQARS